MTPDPVGREAATLPGGGAGSQERDVPPRAGADRAMSIGEVMALLKPEFPDITVSKIRFLEGAGLVHPRRSASGYRKFSEDDVARLRFVLRAQRDQYLPLRVIRERLADLEATGAQPPPAGRPARQQPAAGAPPAAGPPATSGAPPAAGPPRHVPQPPPARPAAPQARGLLAGAPPSDAQFSREELCRAAGTTVDRLAELEEFGLITARGTGERGSWYDGEDLVVLRLARDLADYGLEARHLRMYKIFAEREAALFEQVVSPLVRQRNPEARSRARETLEALAELGSRMRDAALRAAVSNFAEATTEAHR
jgi:DNA-binding transcriptional MerR regulator